MMSFANAVREEIARGINDRDKQFACLYGILLYCRIFSKNQIILQTESPVLAQILPDLFRSVLHLRLEPDIHAKNESSVISSFSITAAEQIHQICNIYHIHSEKREVRLSNFVNNSLSAFLAGAFFGCGSVMDPNKEYHLEFNTPSDLLCTDLQKLLKSIGVDGRRILRKSMVVLYIKDSEQIEDTLTYMGAQQCTIELMNIKIRKDMRNKANRLRNCDEANINKVVSAAMRQTEEIHFLMQCGAMEKLSPELKELALLRLENPELSLKELGEQLSPPIGRSGVNHRFQKIAAYAEELRKNGNGK